ncbi:MAG: RCC1 domain-containing protein [Aquihabitans sp.]
MTVTVDPLPAAAHGDSGLSTISVGGSHTCGITTEGAAKCWGANASGQLGNNSSVTATTPVPVQGLTSGVTAISAGSATTCAIVSGAVKCWGSNNAGQLGNRSTTGSSVPVQVTGLTAGATAVAVGATHACALVDGAATCWGNNAFGQLGNSTSTPSTVPVQVTGLTAGVTAISASTQHTCAVVSGAAKCWGEGTRQQLGNGAATSSTSPVPVTGLTAGVSTISAGSTHTCAVVSGAARCWGQNGSGQLGDATRTSSPVPVAVSGVGSDVTAISAGTSFTCAVASGAARCWGSNTSNWLGDGTSVASSTTPVDVSGLGQDVTAISTAGAGVGHSCAIAAGSAWCWGGNTSGQRGDGVGGAALNPVSVASIVGSATSVASGTAHSCAVVAGAAWCWGANGSGQLGNGSVVSSTVPVPVTGLSSGVTSIDVGASHSCAVVSARVRCWGDNGNGQLGSSGGSSSSPSAPILTGVTAVATGTSHTCAIASGGVICWGSDAFGQIGKGQVTGASSLPSGVVGLSSNVTALSAGQNHTCVVQSGSAKCWGAGGYYRLGTSTESSSPLPVQVPGLTANVTAISAGAQHSCAVVSGSARCWGYGANGELGNGQNTITSASVQVTGLTSGVTAIDAGTAHTCAIVSGAARCWGSGDLGRLGTGNLNQRTTPAPVTGLTTGVSAISAGVEHTCAVANDALSCWGSTAAGQVGYANLKVPNQVLGGDAWASAPAMPAAPTISGTRSPAANAAGWNNEPVVVSFTCSSTALASCTSPVTVSNDGADQSVTGTATDTASQSATATVSGISIDRTAPLLSGVATTEPNAAGWYAAPVTVAWTCSDELSGVAPGTCPADATTTGEGSAVSLPAAVTDRAGNQTTASSASVAIDLTKPSTGVSSPSTWVNREVTLALSPTDALSGVASTSFRIDDGETQTGTSPVVSGQGVHSVEFWSTDLAGNVESPQTVQVRIDVQAPSIGATVSPSPNRAGWNNGPVTVTFECGDEDGGSGVASCSPAQSFDDEVDTSITGTVTDQAGNAASVQTPIRIDRTAPSVTADVPAANPDGWFNQPVQVPFTCADAGGSGIASCPSPAMFAGEGADQPVVGEASDAAGNTAPASGATVSLDTTAPTITGASVQPANADGGHFGAVTVRWTCSDALSGVASCPADQQVSGEGVHVLSRSVTDRAGNTSTGEVTIQINHDPSTDPGIIHGVITDAATGQPVKNATVGLFTPQLTAKYQTKTGTDGSYTFPAVDDGSYKLFVNNWGVHLQAWFPNRGRDVDVPYLSVTHGTNITANQALTPGYVLEGVLTDAGGAPVSGATVRVQGGGVDYWAPSDAAGRYKVTGMVAGARTVSVYAYGFEPVSAPVSIPATATWNRTLTATAPTAGVKGTIRALTATGTPLAGATVRVWLQNGLTYVDQVTTGADGRFQLPKMPAGTYQFDVIRPSYQVRWFGDALNRPSTAVPLTANCVPSADTAWGNPCAPVVDIRMLTP